MPGPVLQMAPLGEPTAKGKTDVLPSRPWVAINEAQLSLAPPSPHLFHVSAAHWERGLQKPGLVQAWLRRAADDLPAPTCPWSLVTDKLPWAVVSQ